jgi:hypothetical protein
VASEVVNRLRSEGKAIPASTREFVTFHIGFHIGENEVAMTENLVI